MCSYMRVFTVLELYSLTQNYTNVISTTTYELNSQITFAIYDYIYLTIVPPD